MCTYVCVCVCMCMIMNTTICVFRLCAYARALMLCTLDMRP